MKGEVIQFPAATVITHRACPGCFFMFTQPEVRKMIYNHRCPKCGDYRLSQFRAVQLEAAA